MYKRVEGQYCDSSKVLGAIVCRLVAFASRRATTVQKLLSEAEFQRLRGLSCLHHDGWGAAWIDAASNLPQRFNSVTRAIDDEDFLGVTSGHPSTSGLLHLRWATAGFPVTLENSHPFVDGVWAFAHNGGIKNYENLIPLLSERRRSSLISPVDSFVYFQLVVQRTEETGDIRSGLIDAMSDVRRECGLGSLNCLVLGPGRLLAAQAQGATSAPKISFPIELSGGMQPSGHDENYYKLRYVLRDESLIVASTGVGLDDWTDVGQDSLIDVDVKNGEFTITDLTSGQARVSNFFL